MQTDPSTPAGTETKQRAKGQKSEFRILRDQPDQQAAGTTMGLGDGVQQQQ